MMLNNTDFRLIGKLEENGRASYIELAQALKINPSTVAKKVKYLLKEGIITIKAVPNPYKLGHTANALIVMNVPMNKIDDVCLRLKPKFNVNLIVTTFGRFNLILGVHYPTWDMLLSFISSELSDTGDVSEMETYFVKGVWKRYYGVSSDNYLDQNVAKIDDVDLRLIEELANNGRYSCLHLSEKMGISLSAVSKRLAGLLKDNVIQIRAIPSATKMGYQSNAYIFIHAEREKIDEICNRLYSYREVSTLMTLMNGYGIHASILARTPETLYDFLKKKVASIPGVTRMETLIHGELIKRYYGTFHQSESDLAVLSKSEPRLK
jgi:DNA-binding Lrp family transcriptional regulator